jgi:hypothetical protein
VLDLHDVLLSEGARTPEDCSEEALIARHDAILTCSHEDAALIPHPRIAVACNGFTPRAASRPSRGSRMILFAGPFRYPPNLAGIRCFLEDVYPALVQQVPGVELVILGGPDSRAAAAGSACFHQPGVRLIDHSVDVEPWLEKSALTINPLPETRGSCLKVIESIGFGRVCVTTQAGARGYREVRSKSLLIVAKIEDFLEPVRRLLLDEDLRVRLERPEDGALEELTWSRIGTQLLRDYERWFGSRLFRSSARVE